MKEEENKQANNTQEMLVLSYNICFQAMKHVNTGSAATLGNLCVWSATKNLTICGENMANFIDGVPGAVNKNINFDFVGLQEASNVLALQKEAKNSLSNLTMIESKSHAIHGGHPIHLASFYDATKYTLKAHVCSQFNSYKTDRPFHILLCEDMRTNDDIIFINLHAPHGRDVNTKTGVKYANYDALIFDLSEAVKGLNGFDSAKKYKIVMTGDFNEVEWSWTGKDLKEKKWQPLSGAKVCTEVAISNVVFSCAKDDGCWHEANGLRGGDYIFGSGIPAEISVPSNYKYTPDNVACDNVAFLKSDHLPVISKVFF